MDTLVREKQDLKYSNVDWYGNIPMDWHVEKIKSHFNLSKERASAEENEILSLTQKGIKVRDISGNEGQMAASYDNYAKLRKGDIVLNPMDLISGYVDLASQEGIISPAYTILRKKKTDLNLKYAKHFFQWHYIFNIFFPFGKGVSVDHRWTLGDDVLLNFPILIPPAKTQEKIADFLDKKTKKVDQIISKKKKLIELLLEKRVAIITKAVSRGLDQSTKMKPSDIEWLGDIPKEWDVRRLKYIAKSNVSTLSENTAPNYLFKYLDIGNVGTGYILRTPAEIYFENAPSRARRIVKKNDTIISTVRTYLKAIYHFENDQTDMIVSTGFAVIEVGKKINPKFFYYLSLSEIFIDLIVSNSYGVSYPAINESFLMTLKAWYPKIDVQKEIVSFLDCETAKINEMLEKIKTQIKKLTEYRSSLIYNAVTGKIKI